MHSGDETLFYSVYLKVVGPVVHCKGPNYISLYSYILFGTSGVFISTY